MSIQLGTLLAVIGAFVGLAGWLAGRDKRVSTDAEWKGMVNAKLDVIVGIKTDVDGVKTKIQEHEGRLAAVESSTKSAHHRLDEMGR